MTETPPTTGTPATTGATGFGYPTRTKIIVVAVLALAISGFVYAGLRTTTGSEPVIVSGSPGESRTSDGVEAVVPGDGTQTLAQQTFGIDLAPGWKAELVFVPGNGATVPLPDDEIEVTALNEYLYQPGEGRTIERLPEGQRSCVIATIWDQVRGREASERTETWCFDVT